MRPTAYPWVRAEARRFHEVLSAAIRQPAHIDLEYRSAGGTAPLHLAQAPNLVWKEALEELGVAGVLAGFVTTMSGRDGVVGHAARALLAVTDDGAPAVEGLLCLDREDLRAHLRLLAHDSAPVRAIVVRGGRGSGKTWSHHLFEQTATSAGGRVVYLGDGVGADVESAVGELYAAADVGEVPVQGDTTSEAWYQLVWRELRRHVSRDGRPLWISVDDLGEDEDGPLLDPELRRFFNALVVRFASQAFRDCFRLMLIHYPDGVAPSRWRADHWREDRPEAVQITVDHVASRLREWSRLSGRRLSDADVAETAGMIVARADGDEGGRLQRLHDELAWTLRRLEEMA